MNVVFWFLVLLALALVWFCASKLFEGIGRTVYKKHDDLMDVMTKEEEPYEEYDSEEFEQHIAYSKEEFEKYYKNGGTK